MDYSDLLYTAGTLAPACLMGAVVALARLPRISAAGLWRIFLAASFGALAMAGMAAVATIAAVGAAAGAAGMPWPGFLQASALGMVLAVLVQLLGSVIGRFSARYLEGETGQRGYVAALAGVLTAVHLLLIADHWLVLIAAWSAVGLALRHLLCFYPERPFAQLAAHKKWIADRLADVLLAAAAALAWAEVGSGALPALWMHVTRVGMSTSLQLAALALVLAVVLRCALLPVHGWLIQVMEAPTPVSALLHAGVINLGGFVLIRFAPLLEQAIVARTLLMVFGLATAVLAGMVMLTRISIKVRLAWSTVAQMGFMLLECALGLYTLAALHLVGHSLYKAHAFLSASAVVRRTRLDALHQRAAPGVPGLVLAPPLAIALVQAIVSLSGQAGWPWWWTAVLGLAWAPLLWISGASTRLSERIRQAMAGVPMIAGLTMMALVAHAAPLAIRDTPHNGLGLVALIGMAILYGFLALLQREPARLARWRRWSYAGFYLDEAFTRLALQCRPTRWALAPGRSAHASTVAFTLADTAPVPHEGAAT